MTLWDTAFQTEGEQVQRPQGRNELGLFERQHRGPGGCSPMQQGTELVRGRQGPGHTRSQRPLLGVQILFQMGWEKLEGLSSGGDLTFSCESHPGCLEEVQDGSREVH